MLKEVGVPGDIGNSRMLSMIETTMCVGDPKVWSRELEREQQPATLSALINWMTSEMKFRMRAAAPIRTGVLPPRRWLSQLSW